MVASPMHTHLKQWPIVQHVCMHNRALWYICNSISILVFVAELLFDLLRCCFVVEHGKDSNNHFDIVLLPFYFNSKLFLLFFLSVCCFRCQANQSRSIKTQSMYIYKNEPKKKNEKRNVRFVWVNILLLYSLAIFEILIRLLMNSSFILLSRWWRDASVCMAYEICLLLLRFCVYIWNVDRIT